MKKAYWGLLGVSIMIMAVVGYILVGIGTQVAAATTCGTCNWYGTNYPVCCNRNTGWGWENNQSCIGCQDCINAGQSCSNCTKCGSSGGGSSSGSCPSSLSCPSGISCGCYTVSGLGANKKALTAAGGSQYMMAAAMMETEKMDTNYTFCDGKSGDSCCCGVTKANFYEARTAGCANTGSGYSTWCSGMNSSRSTDVACWNRIRSYWGSLYWAVHRNGESGKNNPNTTDIQRFKAANDWTNQQLNGHLTDDVRFWCSIPAI